MIIKPSNGYIKPRETIKNTIVQIKDLPSCKHDVFIHEAGHTVLSLVEGVKFDYVQSTKESGKLHFPTKDLTLEQEEQAGIDFLSYPDIVKNETAYSLARIYLAGVEAEIIHSNHIDNSAVVYNRSEQDFSNANKILNLVDKNYDLFYCRMSSRYILLYHWDLVIKISSSLKNKGILRQEDINNILTQKYYHSLVTQNQNQGQGNLARLHVTGDKESYP